MASQCLLGQQSSGRLFAMTGNFRSNLNKFLFQNVIQRLCTVVGNSGGMNKKIMRQTPYRKVLCCATREEAIVAQWQLVLPCATETPLQVFLLFFVVL
jgi:hypothetical protein